MTSTLHRNLKAFNTSITNVTNAMDNRNYDVAISEASMVIDDLTRKILVELLDKRAQARGMKSRFFDAIEDTLQIIEYVPRSATGYLRAGDLYAQQGKQLDAVRIYNRGIKNVPLCDPYHAQLKDAKKIAEERNDKRVDFLKELPMEIVTGILRKLPLSMSVVCDQVSHAWRSRISFCAEIWRSVKYVDKTTLAKVSNLIPRIGLHIEDLSLYATDDKSLDTCSKYLNCMRKGGQLSKLRSLSISGERACKFGREHIAVALWQLRFSLRCLTVNFYDTSFIIPVGGVTLEGILMSCPNLTDLRYLSNQYSIVENLSIVDNGHPLVNLELTCTSIDGNTLKTLLQKCASIRRLVLIPEKSSLVLDPMDFCVYKTLEIFGCYTSMVPDLSEAQRKADTNGLRTFRIADDKCMWAFMRLLHDSMKTLEDVEITLSSNSSLFTTQSYDDLKFENLQSLKLSLYPETQRLFLNAIRDCTNLMDLNVSCEHDLSLLIDTLLYLPPLKRSLCIHSRNGVRREGSDLAAIFQSYLSYPNCTLKCVELHRSDAVTDVALESMAQISTLEEIVLDRCYDVTTAGLEIFLDKLKGHNKVLTSLKLAGMASVQNSTIIKLAKLHSLQFLELKRLENITDKGIIGLADDIDVGKCLLELLTVNECWDITIDSINHIESLIPTLYISHS